MLTAIIIRLVSLILKEMDELVESDGAALQMFTQPRREMVNDNLFANILNGFAINLDIVGSAARCDDYFQRRFNSCCKTVTS